MERRSKKIVADSIAFLKNYPLQDFAEEVYSTPSVIAEIRDLATRDRLQVLPYDLKLKEPSTEAIKFVNEFSKKTGDFSVLSPVDIKVIALTYQLAIEAGLQDKLKKEPIINRTVQVGSGGQKPKDSPETMPGFHVSSKDVTCEKDSEDKVVEPDEDSIAETLQTMNITASQPEVVLPSASAEDELVSEDDPSDNEDDEESNSGDESEDDSDDEGWITPSNIKEAKTAMRDRGVEDEDVMEEVKVACLTADFAMQNVLKQIGLSIISPDGRIIRHVRTYILRCYGCFKTTTVMSKLFCPACGHKTLKRVAASLNDDGTLQLYLSSRKVLTSRGKRFPLPLPKGGKYVKNPILYENQREAEKRATRLAKMKNNPLDDEYIATTSPFVIRDVYSKAAMLGRQGQGNEKLEYWEKKNPNAVTNRGGRRRRK